MKRRSLWIVAVMALTVAVGSAVIAADAIDIEGNPPPGNGCICPANYEPVICKGADGSRRAFSNACVAGCYGYTKCARIVLEQ